MELNSNILSMIEESVSYIRNLTASEPAAGIILGTGLGMLAKEIEIEIEIPYENIPNFPLSTVESHTGKLILGTLSGKKVAAMQGRFHYYEGYTMQQIVFPVRVLKFLGAKRLIISNACGSVNPYFRKTGIMLIDDHINLLGDNPLIGPNENRLGPRFPDMSRPWSERLIKMAEEAALLNNIGLYKGVYAAMSGPSLETRAEYRFLRAIGADVVGMSTVPENIAARHLGMEVLGLSIITDECYPETLKPLTLDVILETAAKAEPNLSLIVSELLKREDF